MINVQDFIHNYRTAFGEKAPLPLLFGYNDQPIATTAKIGGCFFKGLNEARDGEPVSLSADVIGCGGGKLYTGFSDMPERVPKFVSLTEKYKKTPEMVKDYIDSLQMKRAEKTYLNFIRADKAETFDNVEGILFYATPDMLSGLCGWAFFDNNEPDAVVFDPSVRPFVGRDELSFTIPFSRFVTMMDTMKECFLFDSHAWKKVKARIEE